MKRVIILTLFISIFSILCSESINKQNNISELNLPKYDEHANQKPLYERSRLFSDTRLNQGIKGTIRWTSIYLLALAYSDLYTHEHVNATYNLKHLNNDIKPGILLSSFIGIYYVWDTHKKIKNNQNYMFPIDKYGYEIKAWRTGDVDHTGNETGYYITIDKKLKYIDQFLIGISPKYWESGYSDNYYSLETKIDLEGLNYFRLNSIFSPYWGLGLGCSYANIEIDKNNQTKKDISYYPFLNFMVGLRINLWDFGYLKLEEDIEFSTLNYKLMNYGADPQALIPTFSISFGAKIF